MGQRPARRKCRPRHARMLGAATRGTKKEPTGLFFAACGRPCSFDSSYGLHETATSLDIPSRWDPRTKQQPTGLIAYPAAQGRAVPGCGSQRMLHALERRSHSADHGPSFASLFPPLAAVSSAAIPVRVKLKTPLRNAAAATTLDIPTGWDLQQRRPRPVADAGRSCWGSGQQDASAAQGTRGCWEPQPGALKKSPLGSFLPPAGGRVPSIPRTGCMKKSLILRSGILFMTRTGIEPMLQP